MSNKKYKYIKIKIIEDKIALLLSEYNIRGEIEIDNKPSRKEHVDTELR